MPKSLVAAVIFAGGEGLRMQRGKKATPKQFLDVYGKPILVHTLENFQLHPRIDTIYISILPERIDDAKALVTQHNLSKVQAVVPGGKTAQDSIYNALKRLQADYDDTVITLIHDGVRPVLSPEVIDANIDSVRKNGTAVTCLPCHETFLISRDGQTLGDVPIRDESFIAQAPQSFRLGDIVSAHEEIQARPEGYQNMVDACTIYHTLGRPIHMVRGNFGNIKITRPEDMYIFRAIMKYRLDTENFGLA